MLELDLVRFSRLVFLIVLAVAAYSVSGNCRALAVSLCLGVPAIVTQVGLDAVPNRATFVTSAVLGLLFLAYVTVRVALVKLGATRRPRWAALVSWLRLLPMRARW